MCGAGKLSPQNWLVLGIALLLSGVVASVIHMYGKRKPERISAQLEQWDTPRLVRYLEEWGLGLRVVATDEAQTIERKNVFLTRTNANWDQVNRLPRYAEAIERWGGTVYCEWSSSPERRAIYFDNEGDYTLAAGPFVFFGDRELLAEIRAALNQVGSR
jgi:hypothetical protein